MHDLKNLLKECLFKRKDNNSLKTFDFTGISSCDTCAFTRFPDLRAQHFSASAWENAAAQECMHEDTAIQNRLAVSFCVRC